MAGPTISGVTVLSNTSVRIDYTAYTGGSTFTKYSAQYSVNGGSTWLPATHTFATINSTVAPLTLSSLANGTFHIFRISAITSTNTIVSSSSASSSVLVATVPAQVLTWTLAPKPSTSGTLLISAVTAPAANDTSITGYNVQTSDNSGSTWSSATLYAVTSTYDISGLVNGTSYFVRMAAVNRIGTGPYSASKSATPRTVPDAPTGVTVTPGATTVLSIAWTAPTSNGGNALTATPYKIERSLDGVSSWTVLTSAQATSPYNSTGLTNGTLYYYRVSATNAAGFGAVSTTASGTPRTVPGAPTTIGSVTATSSTAASVPFTAPASNGGNAITSYVVTPYIGAAAQTTVSGASSPISVSGLTTGQNYTFKVHAVNAAGSGAQSVASAAVSLVYNSVSAPSGASYTYSSAVALTDSKITYTSTASSDVVITPTGTAWTISAGGNTDTLNFVRKVVFTDKIIYLAGSGVDTNTGSSTVGSNTMSKTIVGGANIIAAYIVNANTEYTANSKVAVIYLAGNTVYTPSVAAADLNIISPVSIVGITMDSKKPLISRWNNHLLRFMIVRSSNVTIENVIFDLNITTGGTEINAGAVDMSFVNGNLTLLENIVFKNVDMVRGYQRGVNMNYMNNITFDGCTFPRVTTRASIGMVSCKNVTIKNCTVPRSGTTQTGYGSIYIGTSNGPRDIYNFTGSGITPQPTFNNNRSGWTAAEKMLALKSTNIDLSLNNTFTDDNSLPATIQLDPFKVENGSDSFQYSPTFTGANPDVKLPSGFAYSFSHSAGVSTAILKTTITRASTDITGTLATWGFAPTLVTVRRLDTNARIYPSGYELLRTTLFISVRNQSRPYYSPLTIDASSCSYTNAVTGGAPVINALYDLSGTLSGSDAITVQFDISRNELLTPVTSQYADLSGNIPYSNAITVYDIFVNGVSVLRTGSSNDYDISYNSGSVSVFPTVPSAPTPHIASHSGNNICFTWIAPENSGGLPLIAYRIYYLASTLWQDAIARNDPDPFFDNATPIDLSSATLVANAHVLTNAAANDVYVFVTRAINAVGISSYTSLYNETPADYAENISRVASQASFLFDGEITPEVASLIEQMVAASGINNYRGTERLRSGLGDNVSDSIYAFFEAATITQVGGANLGQTQYVSGADAQAMYDHMVAANPTSVQQSLLELLDGYLTRGEPFPTTYSRFVINPTTRLQITPYPVIQVTGTSIHIIPVPHGLTINFYLNVVSNVNPDLSGQVLVTRLADNLIHNIVPGNGVTSISGFTSPAAAGSFFYVHLASGGQPIPVMIPALAETVVGLGPDAPTGLRAYNQASTIYVEWDQVSASVGITSYNVNAPGHSWTVTSSNSLAITTLDVGQNWTFTVTAVKDTFETSPATVQYTPANVPCFTAGTRILTPTGYRTVETLSDDDLVVTAEGLTVPIKVSSNTFKAIAKGNAPYIIPAHSFGRNAPPAELRLSPLHAFQIRKGVWQSGRTANNPNVKQYAIGEDVTYYHLECPNFFRDNLIANGCVVESFAGKQVPKGQIVYTPNRRLGGYTRASGPSVSKAVRH